MRPNPTLLPRVWLLVLSGGGGAALLGDTRYMRPSRPIVTRERICFLKLLSDPMKGLKFSISQS
jgi:hypothetical protein